METATTLPLESARAMLAHLRAHPDDAFLPPSELAGRFGLPEGFVRSVLDNVVRAEPSTDAALSRPIRFERLTRLARRSREGYVRAAGRALTRPVLVAAGMNLAVYLGVFTLSQLDEVESARIGGVPLPAIASGLLILLFVTAQLVLFYRVRSVRVPIYVSLVNWSFLVGAIALGSVFSPSPNRPQPTEVAGAAIGTMFLAMGYAVAGVIVALLGAWAYDRQLERADAALSRQDLLERYFHLQTRLERGSHGDRVVHWLENIWLSTAFRRRPVLFVVLFWAGVTLFSMALATMLQIPLRGEGVTSYRQILTLGVLMLIFAFSLLMNGVFGFLSGSVSRGLGLGALAGVVSYLAGFAPFPEFGPERMLSLPGIANAVIVTLGYTLLSGFTGLGGELQRRAARKANVERNDPAAILAEMLRIQWRLSEGQHNVCVMVVDAAKSTSMKQGADPLDVEFSFREYQDWLAQITEAHGGRVHATAGDGAVLAFPECGTALTAARRVQTDVERFNREQNRLHVPFRLRVGLHHGAVTAQIQDVQFTDVIDVAAHLEELATVGGIAASQAFADCLPEEKFVPLAATVDGQPVLLVRDPTEA